MKTLDLALIGNCTVGADAAGGPLQPVYGIDGRYALATSPFGI